MGIHDHLAGPLLDPVHKILHAGDRILRHHKDRCIHQDLIVQKDHLALVIRLQVIDHVARQDAGCIKRDSLPGKNTAGNMLGRLIACRLFGSAFSIGLETREGRTDRGQ